MNKIIVILMCFNLIVSPVVYAQGTTKDKKAGTSQGAGDPFRANPEGKKGGSYMKQILSIGTAAVGTSIMTSCFNAKLIPSLQIFFAGSLVYIASEILGGKTQGDAHKRKASDIKMLEEKLKKGGDLQLATIEMALKEEKDMLAFVNKRKTWLTAIAVIYSAAAVMSIFESVIGKLPTTYPVGMLGQCTNGSAAEGATAPNQYVVKAVVAAYSYGVGKAGGGGMVSSLGSMGVALALTYKTLGSTLTKALTAPEGRIAIFGAAAAMTGLVIKDMGSKASVFKENIANLEKLLAEFKKNTAVTQKVAEGATTSGANGGNTGGNSGTGNPRVRNNPVKPLATSKTQPKNCWNNQSGQMNFTTNCSNNHQLTRPNFGVNINIPTLRTVSNLATDFGQAVSDGDTARADILAGELASMAGRMDGVKKDIMKQMNDSLKSKGKMPIDFEGDINSKIADMTASVSKDLAEKGVSVEASDKDVSVSEEKKESASEITTSHNENTIALPESKPEEGVNLSETGLKDLEADGKVATLEESLNGFESNESDISGDSEVSIFKQVSNRYLLNFNKIFNRKDMSEPTAP